MNMVANYAMVISNIIAEGSNLGLLSANYCDFQIINIIFITNLLLNGLNVIQRCGFTHNSTE